MEQGFNADFYRVDRSGFTHEYIIELRKAYIPTPISHGKFIQAVGRYDDDRELCYRRATASVTQFDILAGHQLSRRTIAEIRDFYRTDERIQYLMNLETHGIALWTEQKMQELPADWQARTALIRED